MTMMMIDIVFMGVVEAPVRLPESLEVIDLRTSQFIFHNNREKYTGLLLLLLSLVFQLQTHKEPSTDPLVAISIIIMVISRHFEPGNPGIPVG